MANTFFQFKQFTVHQEHCAMKVCTDACIQGAFTAQYLASQLTTVPAILDLGAGTGLLSLMLAQHSPATITAVELDPGAAQQATANFAASPWADRLILTQQDIRKMEPGGGYDFVISNPPFYENALKSGHAQKDQAMHATNLTYGDLLTAIDRQLSPAGEVSVLLPYAVFDTFCELALTVGLHLRQVLYIRQSVNHGYFRAVGIFGRTAAGTAVTEMAVYDAEKKYTPAFKALLQPYYLYL
ncbi:tRNA1Val (adenine37-N6)-methyltransferase [Chitinophaga polysaccharea]|uniref:tRNA1(Val) (adenine(37)-N6)-methyltransferase n=1 Tax=Chitinophaga polysaccharea TaxID=1293035 RepID=A0A561P9P7_9BACT|nr:methyltransferase [Chitinophaga polysaccharea]TWF34837.1 tRNA1Val (adenine37-N6)-methyltransferase [Chitinophaga polysaccharea]